MLNQKVKKLNRDVLEKTIKPHMMHMIVETDMVDVGIMRNTKEVLDNIWVTNKKYSNSDIFNLPGEEF